MKWNRPFVSWKKFDEQVTFWVRMYQIALDRNVELRNRLGWTENQLLEMEKSVQFGDRNIPRRLVAARDRYSEIFRGWE